MISSWWFLVCTITFSDVISIFNLHIFFNFISRKNYYMEYIDTTKWRTKSFICNLLFFLFSCVNITVLALVGFLMKGFLCIFLHNALHFVVRYIRWQLILHTILVVFPRIYFKNRDVNYTETWCVMQIIISHMVWDQRILMKCISV